MEALGDRIVPATLYDNTFVISGSGGDATIRVEVSDNQGENEPPEYTWSYTVTNVDIGSNVLQDYINSDSLTSFWVFADGHDPISNLTGPTGWEMQTPAYFDDTRIYASLYAGAFPDPGFLPWGESATFTYTTPPREIVEQEATFGDDTFGEATGMIVGPGTVLVVADLQVTLDDGISYTPGDDTTYTITVTNVGDNAVTGATILDAFAPTFTSVSWTASATGGATGFSTSGSSDINDTVYMPIGSTITYTVVGQTSSSATSPLVNAVIVTVPDGIIDWDSSNNTAVDINEVTLTGTGVIGGRVWQDWGASGDDNGILDSGEAGYEGGTVSLLDQYGTVVQQTQTDEDGDYSFSGLWAGTFTVRFDLPFGWDFTLQNQGSNPAIDSDVDPLTGISGPITLATSSSTNLTVGAGFTRPEPTTLPTEIFTTTYDWNGVATVTTTVTLNAAGYEGLYLWSYHVVNDSFSSGIANFAVPVEDSAMVSNLNSSVSWSPSVGTFLDASDTVVWTAGSSPVLDINDSADFWFTTIPTEIGLTNGIISNTGLTTTPGGSAAIPFVPRGEIPADALRKIVGILVATGEDKNAPNQGETSLREAINWVNFQTTAALQQNQPRPAVLQVRFAKSVTLIQLDDEGQLPEISGDIFIRGEGIWLRRNPNPVLPIPAFRFMAVAEDTTATISGMRFGGLAAGSDAGGVAVNGGAILSAGDLTLRNCIIQDNEASNEGGAIYSSGPSLTIDGCVIALNKAERGGGIYATQGEVRIRNSQITSNEARTLLAGVGDGGGIYLEEDVSYALIAKSMITSNFAGDRGGGIYIRGNGGPDRPLVEIRGSQIQHNRAGNVGGGIAAGIDGSLDIALLDGTIIAENGLVESMGNQWVVTENSKGGGVYLAAGTLTTTNVKIVGNLAASGGGLYLGAGATRQSGDETLIWFNFADDINM